MNRIDRLAKNYRNFWEEVDKLSASEQLELGRKVEWLLPPKLEITKQTDIISEQLGGNIDQPIRESHDSLELVLKQTEKDLQRRGALADWVAKEKELALDDETEFMFFHTRPDWINSPETISGDDEHYRLEVAYEGLIRISLEYDRAAVLPFFRDLLTIAMYSRTAHGYGHTSPRTECERRVLERSENLDKFIVDEILVWNKGTDREFAESLSSAAKRIREYFSADQAWTEAFEEIDKHTAAYLESAYTNTMPLTVVHTLDRHFAALAESFWSIDGIVSREAYERLAFDRLTIVRPRGPGGDTSEHPWSPESRVQFDLTCAQLHPRIKEAAKLCKLYANDSDLKKVVRAKYPDFPDGLIRRLSYRARVRSDKQRLKGLLSKVDSNAARWSYRWGDAPLALEYSAQRCNSAGFVVYEPFSLTPCQLGEKRRDARSAKA